MIGKYLLAGQNSARLVFRDVRETDFPKWLAFHQDPRTTIYWKAEWESPEIECKRWYDKQFYRYTNDLGGMNALIEKATGTLVGHCGLLVQTVDGHAELEIGYSLLPEFWGQGYASEAAMKCRDFAFENNLAESLISIISVTNEPSKAVATRNGMIVDGSTIYNGNEVEIFRITIDEWRNKVH